MTKSSIPIVTIPALPISNLGAVANMVRKCGGDANVINDPMELLNAERIILAGVGAFDAGMKALYDGGWIKPLQIIANDGNIPVLGICLGMQLMCRSSEEGALHGLGWFAADVKKIVIPNDPNFKVPHMGWNTIEVQKQNKLLLETSEERRFYFVHSYHVVCDDSHDVLATTQHGNQIIAAISRHQLYGTQFHPEKSHRFGMEVIKRFLCL